MALLRSDDIRAMRPEDRRSKLKELNDELMHERGVAAMGGAPASPGKMKAIRKNIARIVTIEREYELGLERPTESAAVRKRERKVSKVEEVPQPPEEELEEEAADEETEEE
ncbi:MAG: 50S ribosomal protein L29 [Methanobacteriota archaeon]|nr:MAG: 50S ribosomal protein L29 [Euryarchaeota archaeon]